ncbi:MAG: hypothetical protein K8T20_06915 [Planctomycetes bacterium]|nr:hypothetical protein [Planctomycetota bacterium]
MSPELKKLGPRWVVFGILGLVVTVSLLFKRSTEFPGTPVVKGVYDAVEELPEGSPILISSDFDPGSEAELVPMMKAILAHCWRRHLRVIVMSLQSPNAMPLAQGIVEEAARDNGAKEDEDYALMNYKPGNLAAVLAIGQDWASQFPESYKHRKLADIPAMKGITRLGDFKYVLCITATTSVDSWLLGGVTKYGIKLGLGCTAVMATDYYPLLDTKQITGLLGGLAGAAQYESLVKLPGKATDGMPTQSLIHVTIILFIVAGNILHFAGKRRKPEAA